jgi:dihydroneopterin aldolase
VAKSEVDIFQEQTLSKAEQNLLERHISPLKNELAAIKQREHNARVQSLAAQRMNEASQAGRQAFAADLEHSPEAASAVQELVLTMMYGYEKPAAEAAQIASQVVEKILAARNKRFTVSAKAAALTKPRAPVPASAQSVTAGGTGGVASARPDWFFKG